MDAGGRPPTTTAPRQMKMTSDERAYSGRLEEATGFTIRTGRDAGEQCWWLVDLCGDDHGDPWFNWSDLVADTVETVEASEEIAGLVV